MTAGLAEKDRRQRELLETPVGQKGGGMVRYAAAMHFHRRGLINDELLEIYRICARQDDADPREVARIEGIALPDLLEA